MALVKPPISTHVLDTSKGEPAVGLLVTLYKQKNDESWQLIKAIPTSEDGRCASFLTKENFETGIYKFKFDVGQYFETKGIATIFPQIEIVVDCKTYDRHYHIPLLLNPFGYTTYRGT